MTSVFAIVMECYANRKTVEKRLFHNEMHCRKGDIKDSFCGMIPVAVDKINKMAECGFPRLEVNEGGFAGFLQQ